MSSKTYTQEQLDIAVLKNSDEGILRVMYDMKSDMREMRSEIKTNFHWTLALILGIYVIGAGGLISAVGKAYGWF